MNEKDKSQEDLLTKDANSSESRRGFNRGAFGGKALPHLFYKLTY